MSYNQLTQNILNKDPTGFVNPDLVVVTGNSTNRTIALSGTVQALYQGELMPTLVSGYVSPAHGTDTAQKYYLSYDGTNFVWNTTVWTFDQIMIAIAKYDSNAAVWKYYRECHGLESRQVHQEFHEAIGTYKKSGGDFSSYTLDSTTAANRRPDISSTLIKDEDCPTTNAALTSKLYTQFSLGGAGIESNIVDAADMLLLSTNNPYYNQFTTTRGQTLMPANSVATIWIYSQPMAADATSQKYRYIFVQPQWITQAANSSGGAITAAVNTEDTRISAELNLNGLVAEEIICIGKVIIAYTGGNRVLKKVSTLLGNKVSQTVAPAGNFLTQVAVDSTLTGDGTTGNPLSISGITAINTQTGTTYTLALTDAGKLITCSNAATITVTVPPNSSVAFTIGTQIDLIQIGAGKVTLAQGSGVTISSKGSNKSTNGQYVGVSLIKTATDTRVLVGDLVA